MKLALVFLCAVVAVFAIDVYPTKYDEIDVDSILNNKRLFANYAYCILNKGKCNEEGQILKEVIPDALITGCCKCNEIQKTKTEKVIRYLIEYYPDVWTELRQTYDPNNQYYEQYKHYLDKH